MESRNNFFGRGVFPRRVRENHPRTDCTGPITRHRDISMRRTLLIARAYRMVHGWSERAGVVHRAEPTL
jgi:hypothetical protein